MIHLRKIAFLLLNFLILSQITLASEESCHQSKKGPVTLLSDQVMTISKVNSLSENIPAPEDELIRIVVVKQVKTNSNVNLRELGEDDTFLKSALGKGVTFSREGSTNLNVNKSIMGFNISFKAKLENLGENKIQLSSYDYSHVFIKSVTTLSKNPEGKTIDIKSISYLKKSSFDKLNKITLGGAVGFIKRGIKAQLKFTQAFLRNKR